MSRTAGILIGKPFVGAAVHYRPGVALGFGLFARDGAKTQCHTGTELNPLPYREKTDNGHPRICSD
jgi:hypothetical protein